VRLVLLGNRFLGVDIAEALAEHLKFLGKVKDFKVTDKTVELLFKGDEVVIDYDEFASPLRDTMSEDMIRAFWRSVWEKVIDGIAVVDDERRVVLHEF